MNNIILRRRPIKLGRAAQHMTDKGFVLTHDNGVLATWRKEWIENSGRMGFSSMGNETRTMVIQLEGPHRHDGEIIEDHRGCMRLKMANGKTYKSDDNT